MDIGLENIKPEMAAAGDIARDSVSVIPTRKIEQQNMNYYFCVSLYTIIYLLHFKLIMTRLLFTAMLVSAYCVFIKSISACYRILHHKVLDIVIYRYGDADCTQVTSSHNTVVGEGDKPPLWQDRRYTDEQQRTTTPSMQCGFVL